MAKATGQIAFSGLPATNARIVIDDGQSNGGFSSVTFNMAGTSGGGGELTSASLGSNASKVVNVYSDFTTSKGFFRIAFHIDAGGGTGGGSNADFKDMATGGSTPLIYEFGDAAGNFVNITLVNESSGFTSDVSGASFSRKDSAGNYSLNVNNASVNHDNVAEELKDILTAADSAGEIVLGAISRQSTYWLQISSNAAGDAPMSFRIKRASGAWTSTASPAATVTKSTSTASSGIRAQLFAPNEPVYSQRNAETGGSGTLNATQFGNYVARMINALQIQITASASNGTVSLTNENHGTEGNVTITTTDATNFTLSGMSGGSALGGGPAVAKRLKISARQIAISGSGGLSGSADGKSALMLDIAGLSAASIAQADVLAFADANDSELANRPKKITFSNFEDAIFANVSGDIAVAAGGAATIQADAVESGMLNDNIISGQTELAHADIADADELMISDGGVLKRVGVDSIRDHFFGVVSGDATVADGGALTIANGAVESGMLNDNIISGQSELASGLALTDEFLVSDAGTIKRMDVSVLAEAIDGAGLSNNAGLLDVDASQTGITSILNASLVVGRDSDNKIDFSTDNQITMFTNGSGELRVTDDGVYVKGNLTVDGSTVTLDVANLQVEDTVIGLGISGSTEGAAGDRAVLMHIASESNPVMFWDESENEFAFARVTGSASDTTISLTGGGYADLRVNAIDVEAASTIASLKVEDLTSGRVVLAGTGGEIEDSGNLTFNGSQLTATGHISASQNIYAGLAVTASFFSGDGSGLTGVGASVAEASAGGDAGGNLLQLTFVSGAASAASFFMQSGSLSWRPSTDTLETVNISGSGNLDIAGTLDLDGAAALRSTLSVTGLISGSGGMDVAGQVDLGAALNVQGLISGSGGMDIAGAVDLGAALNVQGTTTLAGVFKPTGVADAEMDASKSMVFIDSDGSMKKESFSDVMEISAGTVTTTGIENSSGVLSVAIHSLIAEDIATGDKIAFSDSGDNGLHSETVDDLFKIGPALVSAADIAVGDDHFLFLDGGASGDAKKESIADLATAQAGAGIQASSGVFSVKSRQDVFALTASIGISGSGPLVMKETPATTGSVMVFFNGLLQTQGTDYSLGGSGNKTISLKGANTLASQDEVVVKYIKS